MQKRTMIICGKNRNFIDADRGKGIMTEYTSGFPNVLVFPECPLSLPDQGYHSKEVLCNGKYYCSTRRGRSNCPFER